MSNMNANQPESRLNFIKNLLSRILLQNLGIKVLSVALALVLWTCLITQDPTLMRDNTFTDVAVNVINEDVMKRNGYLIISDLDEALKGVTVRVEVPQGKYSAAKISNYNIRLDLSPVNSAGEQELQILSTNSPTYGNVLEITPNVVKVQVEKYETVENIPVIMNTTGSLPETYALSPTIRTAARPAVVSIKGPASLLKQISNVEVPVDLSTLNVREGSINNGLPFLVMTSNGQEIDQSLLEVYSEGVKLKVIDVQHEIVRTRTTAVSSLGAVVGTPAEGYQLQSVTLTPAEIVATGYETDLDDLGELYVGTPLDITGVTETTVQACRLMQVNENVMLKPSMVTVTAEIGPIIETRTFDNIPIKVVNVGKDLIATMSNNIGSITITGPVNELNKISESTISLVCDANSLSASSYLMPVLCKLENVDRSVLTVELMPEAVRVDLEAK